ncbi:hypothetical protein CFR79_10140 [Komagataeibacter saccharivorans]|nr:hypothetical protein CFR79_10140 [Komagataeibacter saccharivorans]
MAPIRFYSRMPRACGCMRLGTGMPHPVSPFSAPTMSCLSACPPGGVCSRGFYGASVPCAVRSAPALAVARRGRFMP